MSSSDICFCWGGTCGNGKVYTSWVYGGDNKVHRYTYHSGYNCNTNTTPYSYDTSYNQIACTLFVEWQ